MSQSILTITDDSFERDILQSNIPVLVDFWAEWCGPCKMIAPIFEEVSKEKKYVDKVKFAKVNVDQNNDSPAKYGVRGIPTLLIFVEGNVVATKVGAFTKSELINFIDQNISS